MTDSLMRIAKFIARSGYCSRREAEKVILAGRVTVNENVVRELHIKLDGSELVKIDDIKLKKIEPTKVWIYHKREGLLTTKYDPEGRETIYDDLPVHLANIMTVGRLDKNTEGLLLLTNDGEYARKLELPQNEYKRTYRVRVFGRVYEDELYSLRDGITIDDIEYKAIIVDIESQSTNNTWLQITLLEGKNREIRNVLGYLGLRIKRLIRISYGPYKIGNIVKGEVKEVEEKC